MQINLRSLGAAQIMGNFLVKLQDVPLDSIIDLFKKLDFLTKNVTGVSDSVGALSFSKNENCWALRGCITTTFLFLLDDANF